MTGDPAVVSDDDLEEVTPGVFRRVGDCTDADLEAAIQIRREKTRLYRAIIDLQLEARARDLQVSRRMRRELAKLEQRSDRTGRLRDLQRVHEVLAAVVNGGKNVF